MNDRVFKQQLVYNNKTTNSNLTLNTFNITNTLNKNSCDSDFYEIFQLFTMILNQDVNKVCNNESILRLPIIPPTVVFKLCQTVKTLFETENILLRLQGQIIIVGDLHGHIMDLFRIVKRFGLPPRTRYLFLGDIVDRGEFSLETIIFIYAMKALFPNEIYIIRGNHEFEEVCSLSGFLDDILATYKSKALFSYFIESFDVMPIAAIINDSILCVHAGIGPNIHSITDIIEESSDSNQPLDFNTERQSTNLDQKQYLIKRPIHDFSNDIIASLMWSDPTEKRQENRKELPSLISPLTGARILTVRPIIENKRAKRAISNDFNINHMKLAFPKNFELEGDISTEAEPSHLANFQDKNNDNSKTDDYTVLNTTNINNNISNNTTTTNTPNTQENSINHTNPKINTLNPIPNSTSLSNLNTQTHNDQNAFKYSEGFSPSSRGYGYLFDKQSFDIFMTNSNLTLLLRGHQCVHSGISSTFDNKLTTVFSASHYCGSSSNSCGVFLIQKFGNRTESFKSLPYLRRDVAVFIPPEKDDSFVIPKTIAQYFQTADITAVTARPRMTSNPSSNVGSLQPSLQQQMKQKKKASIFSPASLIATKGHNPLATFEVDTAKSEDDEVDPFQIRDGDADDVEVDVDGGNENENVFLSGKKFGIGGFGFGGCGDREGKTRTSKRHSALAQLTCIGSRRFGGVDGVGMSTHAAGFTSDDQDTTSRRFLRLPCINGAKKPVFYGDA